MNSYLVERYLPGLAEADLRAALGRVKAVCAELSAAGTPIRYGGSTFLALEETCFCRFDTERADTAAQANELARFPFARITEAIVIEPQSVTPSQ